MAVRSKTCLRPVFLSTEVDSQAPHCKRSQPKVDRVVLDSPIISDAKRAFEIAPEAVVRFQAEFQPFRNREAMWKLARFLLWKHSGERLDGDFPVDRRALAEHPDLDLSEKAIRNAVANLLEVGFLTRGAVALPARRRAPGVIRCDAVMFAFGGMVRSLWRRVRRWFSKGPVIRSFPVRDIFGPLGSDPVGSGDAAALRALLVARRRNELLARLAASWGPSEPQGAFR